MKYDAFVYNKGNSYPIGEVKANSLEKLKQAGRNCASNFNKKGGRAMIEDKNTLKTWNINF